MERNSRIFKDKASSMNQLKGAFVTSLFDWARVRGFTQTTLVIDFVDSLFSPIYVEIILSSMCTCCAHRGIFHF